MSNDNLRNHVYNCLLDLATEEGINASGKEEIFGCIFGRDSALTVLKILRAHSKNPSLELLAICRRALLTLTQLQGKEFNLESGEQPGKFIHEFRKENFDSLLNIEKPWFIYPDGFLRNYDSIDSTPLALIAIYKYYQITGDNGFLILSLPAVEAGLNWIITFGDIDKDSLIEYELPEARTHGGLVVQSWTDSHESLTQNDGRMPKYPIAPIEAQAYAWLALKLWSDFYQTQSPKFARKLLSQSKKLKRTFNQKFILKDQGFFYGAQALDGDKNQIKTVTSNPLLCLWAAYQTGSRVECIVEDQYINDFINRAFMEDLFVDDAGLRTMSSFSATFNPKEDSYHNGSFWPILNGLITEGLENFYLYQEAEKLKVASIKPLTYFGSPIELYIKSEDGNFQEYRSPSGQTSCKTQAWSAAATLDFLT